ncbi:MAG: ABC transporter ATP-binding protein [Pseudomonadota bacterium]|nr:ABC transporter ATP-binding protein [Pseudomonadota bacterium]
MAEPAPLLPGASGTVPPRSEGARPAVVSPGKLPARIRALTWPMEDLGEVLGRMAAEVGAPPNGVAVPMPRALAADVGGRGRWLEAAAAWLGAEAEPVHVSGGDLDAFARGAGPAILTVGPVAAPRLLAVRGRDWRGVRVIAPDLREHRLSVPDVVDALHAGLDAKVHADVDGLLDAARLRGGRRDRVRRSLLYARTQGEWLPAGWLVRLPASAPIATQARSNRLGRRIAALASGHALEYGLGLAGWAMIGRGALSGRLEAGWLVAWALLVLTLVPVRAALTRAEGRLALDVGAFLKQRLLVGALRLAPEEVRHQGVGQLLGRVIESENVESLATSGGLLSAFAVLELVLGAAVLAAGAGGAWHAGLLLAWSLGVCGLGAAYYRRRVAWSGARLTMTNDLVEALVGHRTRLAQEDPAHWHDAEDAALSVYLDASARMDGVGAWLDALAPGGWIVIGLLGLAPALVAGPADTAALAVSVGGVLLAYGSLRKLVVGVAALAGAGIAWEQVRDLFWAAERAEPAVRPTTLGSPDAASPAASVEGPLLEGHALCFRHPGRAAPVFSDVHLVIRPGDHVLVEGPSGGGKSTLASLLAGLRLPSSGVLVLGGLDRRTLGPDGWRGRVVTAPQFHENHVLGSSLAFNLLMGRSWPPRDADLVEAEALCVELGLGPLIERMPSGLSQMVGETGWQLSHGEKSRLYIARALLQGSDLVVLDESFAALDPDNLRRAMECVLTRARAVVVIAHP